MKKFHNGPNIIPYLSVIVVLLILNVVFFLKIDLDILRSEMGRMVHNAVRIIDPKPLCKNCNVILISLDTLNANHLPCYGYKRDTAPNLCRFARENIMAKNMFSNSNYTLPSHVSIFTGLYPNQHKVNAPNRDTLSRSLPFLPEILQKNGYETYLNMGIDDPYLPIDRVFYRGINGIKNTKFPLNWEAEIDRIKENNRGGKKTFLFLHTYWTHSPYIPNDERKKYFGNDGIKTPLPKTWNELSKCAPRYLAYLKKSLKKDLDDGFYGNGEKKKIAQEMWTDLSQRSLDDSSFCSIEKYKSLQMFEQYYGSQFSSLKGEQIQHVVNLYDSKIKELDTYLQKVFDKIVESELKDNTVIIITSDHGEEFGEHGQFLHGATLYDDAIKVPLILYIPGQKGKHIDRLAQSVDIMPTLLNIVGINYNLLTSGIDLFDYSSNAKIISQNLLNNMAIVRNQVWKLFVKNEMDMNLPYALYNIQNDPQENDNRILKEYDVVRGLYRYLPIVLIR